MKRVKDLLCLMMVLGLLPAINAQLLFEDISEMAGIQDGGKEQGVAIADYDNDGLEDIYFSTREGNNMLYRNLGDGQFEMIEAAIGIDHGLDTRTSAWIDIDNDGYPELYVGVNESPDRLYKNNGDGTFTDITESAGIDNPGKPYSIAIGDLNGDGLLDIYIANFQSDNQLYQNNGDGSFANRIDAADAPGRQNSMGAVLFDYDVDGDLDLFMTHDGPPNVLYENIGGGNFADVSAAAGIDYAGFGMGVDVGDINNDGFLDIYVTYLWDNQLFLNNGDGTFENITESAGVGDRGMGWGTNFIDFDNDGLLDIYVSNDSYFSPFPNVVYRNMGDETFEIVGKTEPISSERGTYGSALMDINMDGLLDVCIANFGNSDVSQLFMNTCPDAGNYILLDLESSQSNMAAIGARLEAMDDNGVMHVDEVIAGSSFASSSTTMVHFGLGSATMISNLKVIWPNGDEQMLENLDANCRYKLIEGGEPVAKDCQVLSNNNLNLGNTRVYPNPGSDVFTIELDEQISELQELTIIDALGKRVADLPLNKSNIIKWNPDDAFEYITSGNYYLMIRNKEGVGVIKLTLIR